MKLIYLALYITDTVICSIWTHISSSWFTTKPERKAFLLHTSNNVYKWWLSCPAAGWLKAAKCYSQCGNQAPFLGLKTIPWQLVCKRLALLITISDSITWAVTCEMIWTLLNEVAASVIVSVKMTGNCCYCVFSYSWNPLMHIKFFYSIWAVKLSFLTRPADCHPSSSTPCRRVRLSFLHIIRRQMVCFAIELILYI